MGGGLECFLGFVVVTTILGVAWYHRSRASSVTKAYASVAGWFRGRVERRGWGLSPLLRIPYHPAELVLTTSVAENGRRCTEAIFDVPVFHTDVRITSQTLSLKWLGKSPGKVRMGDAEFERQYRITSEDSEAARALLTGGVRNVITLLGRVKGGPIDIRFGSGQLIVQKVAVLDQAPELTAFVRHSLELLDQVMLSRSEGIEFVEQLGFQAIEDAKCPVCLDTIADDLVFCGRCKTAHHRECWIYSGKCSTYACGETQFVVPRVAKPR